jgi:hypothetical protein
MNMKNDFTPKSRKDNLVVQELDGEVLIYDLNKNKAVCLNQTSALVWQACDGSRTIADISDAVGKQLNSQVNEDIIWLALDQLSKENLVEKQTESGNKFKGLSRREVIKKAALGTVIALPIVTSLVAPLAVHANSSCITGGTCLCDVTMGSANGEICVSTIVPCGDLNCLCQRTNQGNAAGTCVP